MKLCFTYLKESQGRIINFGSSSGLKGVPGYSGYGSVKEAIRSLSRTVANEWGKYGITCNVICPTSIGEKAQESHYITGQTLRVDGGGSIFAL